MLRGSMKNVCLTAIFKITELYLIKVGKNIYSSCSTDYEKEVDGLLFSDI